MPATIPATEPEYVQGQLLDLVDFKFEELVDYVPFGSTYIRRERGNLELVDDRVEIPIETDILPVWVRTDLAHDGIAFDVEFRLVSVRDGYATYSVERK